MSNKNTEPSNVSYSCGCLPTLGVILAVIVSYSYHPDVGWAIFHGFLGWLYLIWVFFGGQR